jgi:hypothetical protein
MLKLIGYYNPYKQYLFAHQKLDDCVVNFGANFPYLGTFSSVLWHVFTVLGTLFCRIEMINPMIGNLGKF